MLVKASRTKQFMSHDNRRQVNCRYQLLPDNAAFSALRTATLHPAFRPRPRHSHEMNANSVCYRFSQHNVYYFYYTRATREGGWQIMGFS